jgi:hypothetical protein
MRILQSSRTLRVFLRRKLNAPFTSCSGTFHCVCRALICAGFASLAAFPAVIVSVCVAGALCLTLAADLRTEFAEAGMTFRTAHHRRGGFTANGCAIQAHERASDHFPRSMPDVRGSTFIAGHGRLYAGFDCPLHVTFGFLVHKSVS